MKWEFRLTLTTGGATSSSSVRTSDPTYWCDYLTPNAVAFLFFQKVKSQWDTHTDEWSKKLHLLLFLFRFCFFFLALTSAVDASSSLFFFYFCLAFRHISGVDLRLSTAVSTLCVCVCVSTFCLYYYAQCSRAVQWRQPTSVRYLLNWAWASANICLGRKTSGERENI